VYILEKISSPLTPGERNVSDVIWVKNIKRRKINRANCARNHFWLKNFVKTPTILNPRRLSSCV
jgi:hypothetical protein